MRLVDLTAGSGGIAALGMGSQAFVTWQGSKRFYARGIQEAIGVDLAEATTVTVAEASPWWVVYMALRVHGVREVQRVLSRLLLDEIDPEESKRVWLERRARCMRGRPMRWAAWTPSAHNAAMWLWLTARSYGGKGPSAGYCPRKITLGPRSNHGLWRYQPGDPLRMWREVPEWQVDRLCGVYRDARLVPPAPGVYVAIDPDYAGTTRYRYGSLREDTAALAVRWWQAGARRVWVHEAEPVAELVALGWEAVEIEREGPRRNRSKQQAEWMTLSPARAAKKG